MQNDVFSQIRDWRQRRAAKATPAEIQRVATMQNDKTFADEAAWIVRGLLYLSAAFCAWASYYYYRDYLSESFSPAFVTVFSIALPITVEMMKVKITQNVLRSVFFRWMFESGWSLGYWFFLAILAAGAYWWSVTISTDGMEKFSAMKADQHLQADSLPSLLAAATADIDRQIADAQRNYDSAIGTKWKGTTTYQAQKAAQSQSASMQDLQSQREKIVTTTTEDYKQGKIKRTDKIDAWSAFVRKFGGYFELSSILCLVTLGFLERRLFALYSKQIPEGPSPTPDNERGYKNDSERETSFSYSHSTTPTYNGNPLQNSAGFTIRPHGSFSDAFQDTVARSPQTVARSNAQTLSTDPDAVLQLAKTRLQSHVANFGDRQRRPATTAANCRDIINEVGHKMQGRGFEPSPKVAADFYHYVQTVFDAMHTNGHPYDYPKEFLARLGQFLPAEAAAA